MAAMTPEAEKLVEETCSYSRVTLDCAGRGDGYLWDADGDGYDPSDVTWPCPACNTREYLESAVEHASGWSGYQWTYTSGAEHWRSAVKIAMEANPAVASAVRAEIGPVECDDWRDPDAPDPNDMVTVLDLPVVLLTPDARP